MKHTRRLNRYTSLPVLLDMLKRKKLVLLDPGAWEDKNDSEIMLEYKKRKNLRALFALCLSYGDETIHHWKTFADGISGCCIEFDSIRLSSHLKTLEGVRFGPVTYKKLKDLHGKPISTNRIPFTKRWPYRCEEEFRVIWESSIDAPGYEIDFDLTLISKITISQRMPKQIYTTIRNYLRHAFQDPEKRINRSTLYENHNWIEHFRKT